MKTERKLIIPEDLVLKCVKCGLCKSVCPSYYGEEGSYARGRLALAEMVAKGEVPLNEEIAKQWNECAMCRRCEWVCPNDVQYKEILVQAKELQEKELGRDIISKAGLKSLEFMQSDLGRKVIKAAGKLSSFLPSEIKTPLPTGAVKFMPKPYGKPFGIRGKTFKAQEEKGRLLFFTGCMIDVFYGKTGESVIKLMNRLGYTVVVPEDIKCCGAPHLYHGNTSAFERLKEHNLREMEKYDFDAIVVACPTCGGALIEDYGKDWKVYDFAELLFKEGENQRFKTANEKLTFHVPCHSYTAMKVDPQVFYGVMERVEGAEVVKAEKAQSCCGFAGLWSIKNPKLSEKVQREKMEDFKSTEADYVLTTCPGCVLQLRDGVRKFGNRQEIKHLADYLVERID
ncbi:glycolate oxidase iron-sulfur subunit [Hydrogenivirga caldilitoris]|uniref:Glycolate oxidase iron-sulfur subunit n=1 Tax=Hydrogenivirga caldilitoris TaxID=246264 RepID=A0A497XM49_9AQUI|nr:(Fe-S)-binding protein [Hydrogenivirga caldilitoris]RLJ69925.1 glycolate oxidase iron-sulfur subunit [Hydrogenivirga caldilitoris]